MSPDAVTAVGERQTLWHAIEKLPDRQRAVIVLRYYEDLPDAEIARLLGCAEVTVSRRTDSGSVSTLQSRLSARNSSTP